MTAPARPLQSFARLDALQLPLPDLMGELQRHLDAALGIDSLVVHWYDEAAAMNEFYADPHWHAEAITAYVADSRGPGYRQTALQRLRAGRVYSLGEEVLRDRPIYASVLQPLGLGAVLSLPFWQPGLRAVVGCVRASRGRHGAAFDAASLRLADRLREPLGRLLSLAAPPPTGEQDRSGRALMVLDADGELLQACPEGRRLLALLSAREQGWEGLQARLRQAIARPEGPATELELALSAGRYRLRLRPLGGAAARPWVAVEWERRVHPELRLLSLAREAGLSRRELEVARALLQGERNEAIARRLGVADSTIKTLVRSLFTRLQVADRQAFWRLLATAAH